MNENLQSTRKVIFGIPSTKSMRVHQSKKTICYTCIHIWYVFSKNLYRTCSREHKNLISALKALQSLRMKIDNKKMASVLDYPLITLIAEINTMKKAYPVSFLFSRNNQLSPKMWNVVKILGKDIEFPASSLRFSYRVKCILSKTLYYDIKWNLCCCT